MARVYLGGLSHRAGEKDVERFFRGYGKVTDVSLKNGYGFVEFEDYRDADDAVYELSGKDLCGERITIEHARGTPHGRDRERWGPGDDIRERDRERERERERDRERERERERDRERERERRYGYGGGGGGFGFRGRSPQRPRSNKYGPPTRTEHRVIVENLSSRISWQNLKDYIRQAGSDVTYADAHRIRKNEAVVEFATREDMKKAIEKMNGTELNGRSIKMFEDGKRKRSESDSRSRSRSRSRRSRSRSRRSRSRSGGRSGSRGDKRGDSRDRSPNEGATRSRSPSQPQQNGEGDCDERANQHN